MKVKKFKTPILLITFRRPEHTLKILSQIKEINPKILYIISDGFLNSEHKDKVLKTRKIIDSIKWCVVKKKFLKSNIGLKHIGKKALDWIFEKNDKAIILEDDTLPSKSFFTFCEELLNKYEYDKRISQISGSNLLIKYKRRNNDSYFFSKYSNIWGWATWKDRWNDYDIKMKNWNEFKNDKWINDLTTYQKEKSWWMKMFKIAYKKINYNDWDYQWTFTNFINNRVSIVPSKNLISNIGHDDPTGNFAKKYNSLPTNNLKFPLKHPNIFLTDKKSDEILMYGAYSTPQLKYRLKNKFIKILQIIKNER